jgi:hypothetical protein
MAKKTKKSKKPTAKKAQEGFFADPLEAAPPSVKPTPAPVVEQPPKKPIPLDLMTCSQEELGKGKQNQMAGHN